MIFVDSSAFFAILSASDINHQRADSCLRNLRKEGQTLLTNNYIIVESITLVQRRLGLENVRHFQENILPLLETGWMDEEQHNSAVEAVFQAKRRGVSLVDCSAFETMRRLGIETVFTFDKHFHGRGYEVIP